MSIPLVVPLTPVSDTHDIMVNPVVLDGQAEFYNWTPGVGGTPSYITRAANVPAALAALPARKRVLFMGNFACPETRVDGVDEGGPWLLNPDTAAMSGVIPDGPTLSYMTTLGNALRPAGASSLRLTLCNCEAWSRIWNALVTHAADWRAVPNYMAGSALRSINTSSGYGTANYEAALSATVPYTYKIVDDYLAKCLAPVAGRGPIANTPSGGGEQAWSVLDYNGHPIIPRLGPGGVWAPQLYLSTSSGLGAATGLSSYQKWAGFLAAIDSIRSHAMARFPRKPATTIPVLTTPSFSSLSLATWRAFFEHYVRTLGSPDVVAVFNQNPVLGEMTTFATMINDVCRRNPTRIASHIPVDYSASSITTGDYTTSRDAVS